MKKLFLGLIFLYKKTLSPLLAENCRFYPSCSDYARDAFHTFSIGKSLWMITKRVCKCHPLHPGGYDPVIKPPEVKK